LGGSSAINAMIYARGHRAAMMWIGPFGDGWGWFWPFHFVIPLLVLDPHHRGGGVWIVRYTTDWGDHPRIGRRQPGLDILEERYARGEINCEEYLLKKRDIIG
jgi:putative membrane protein